MNAANKKISGARFYSRNERWMDAAIHGAGIVFALGASSWLLAHVAGSSVVIGASVYCGGLLGMIAASAAYNLCRPGPAKEILRRVDHAAIFVMIAGTYTPLAMNRLSYEAGTTLLVAIWLAALVGAAIKVFFPNRFERVGVVLYLAMGWMVVAVIQPLSHSLAATDLWLLVAGGLVYSAGVAFYLFERVPFHKAIWHGFVLVAAMLQFCAISAEFATY